MDPVLTPEVKVNVDGKDGSEITVKIIKGTDFHTLEEETDFTFETNEIDAFVTFVAGLDEKYAIYYSEKGASCYPIEVLYNTKPAAVITLQHSSYINLLSEKTGKILSIDSAEQLLLAMKPYFDPNARKVYDFVRDFKIESAQEITRAKDNRGNFEFAVKRSAGNTKLTLPETMCLEVPVFMGVEHTAIFEFEPVLDYSVDEGRPVVTFQFLNYQYSDDLLTASRRILDESLLTVGLPKYWGSFKVNKSTNEWRYHHPAK